MKVAFLDRDGTLIWEPPESKQVDSLAKLRILPGVVEGLRELVREGFELVMVTNQDGLGTEAFPREAFEVAQQQFLSSLADHDITFREVFICPHLQTDGCSCRKPQSGLLDDFLERQPIDRSASIFIGDRDADLFLAERIGVQPVRMQTNGRFPRFASVKRSTGETQISLFLNLDGRGDSHISTGIGFFDHMLTLFARHSLIDLSLNARGDLEVDEHHTVEDTALALGKAIRTALGDKQAIERYGFWLPMDEALAEVIVDLSGRACFVFEGVFRREYVGELPTELVPHFFESLAQAAHLTLHMKILRGRNEHHKVEALFKGLGRCLRNAFRQCPHEEGIPSTKGTL